MKKRIPWILLMVLAVAVGGTAWWTVAEEHDDAQKDSHEKSALKKGAVTLQSIGALETGPDGILFVADSVGTSVYALDVGTATAQGEAQDVIEDLDGKIAAMLGTQPRDLFIQDMAVDTATGTAYLSLHRGKGDKARPVLVRVLRDGTVSEVDLAAIPHARVSIDNAPAADAEVYRRPARTLTVTDMELIDGELFIAGLSNEEFASTLRRVPWPFTDEVKTTGLEIYHGAHGKYETHAPIYSFIPYQLDGKAHVLAGYLCTPLVTFPVDEVRSKAKLRGKTIAELGFGNIPLDMVAFERDGEGYLLIRNSTRGPMLIPAADLHAAHEREGITTEVGPRTGVDYLTPGLGAAVQIDDLDSDHIMILGRSLENGSLMLHARGKRWL